ncbi:MAG: methyltransferase domain-containing protein [Pseudomonadota bacterium]
MIRFILTNWHLVRARAGWRARRAPVAYVRALFDGYAEEFDDHVMRRLSYKVPNLIRRIAEPYLVDTPRILDLGCGTGICGALLAPQAAQMVGIDLSQEMLIEAKRKRCYDALYHGDLTRLPPELKGQFDLAIAGDVFCYHGDLAPVLGAAAEALTSSGALIFSLETEEGEDDWRLTRTGRFAHHPAYVTLAAEAAGFTIVTTQQATLRTQRDVPVEGAVMLLRRA